MADDMVEKLSEASTPIAGAALKRIKKRASREDGGHIRRALTLAGLDGTPPTQALVLDPHFNNTSNRQKTAVRKTKNDLAAILLDSRQRRKADGQPVQTIKDLIADTGISKKVYFYMRYGA